MTYSPLQVELAEFEGPLDLLLHLVRKRELDIGSLCLSELTEPYLEWVGKIQAHQLDEGGEFLTIAATLIWIKSRSLLPGISRDGEEEDMDAAEVEAILAKRLQFYQELKEAAEQLGKREMLGREVFPRRAPEITMEGDTEIEEREIEEVSLYGLLEAFREVLERVEGQESLQITPEPFRMEEVIRRTCGILIQKRQVYFGELFAEGAGRLEMVSTFIVLLEFARLGVLHLLQEVPCSALLCRLENREQLGEQGLMELVRRSFGIEWEDSKPTKAEGYQASSRLA